MLHLLLITAALQQAVVVAPESGEVHLKNIRQLTFGGQNAEAYFSASGGLLIFQRQGPAEQCDQMYVMGVDGSNLRRLTTTLGYDGGPFFSPDGKRVVYRASHPQTASDSAEYRALLAQQLVRPTQMDIWVMNADGSDQRQVTGMPGASFAPFSPPDGRRVIFSSNYRSPESRDFDLYMVNLDGTGLEQITTAPGSEAFPMFSPDGQKLVWASNRGGTAPHETNIFIADWVERP